MSLLVCDHYHAFKCMFKNKFTQKRIHFLEYQILDRTSRPPPARFFDETITHQSRSFKTQKKKERSPVIRHYRQKPIPESQQTKTHMALSNNITSKAKEKKRAQPQTHTTLATSTIRTPKAPIAGGNITSI